MTFQRLLEILQAIEYGSKEAAATAFCGLETLAKGSALPSAPSKQAESPNSFRSKPYTLSPRP